MPYAQVEVSAPRHRKLSNLSDVAFRLWVTALCYCQEHLTDGLIHAEALGTLTPHRIARAKVVDELVGHGLWVPTADGGYHVHDYLTWNESRAQVEARKAKMRERQDRWRAAKGHAVSHASHNALQDALVTPLVTRPRVRAPALRSVSLSGQEGEFEREERPAEPASVPLADDVWQLWRAVAAEHGQTIRLAASPTQTEHLLTLARTYTLDDLGPAMRCWWASPHVVGRNIGLFVSQVDEVLAHLAKHTRSAFRAPAAKVAAPPPSPGYRSLEDWVCPHEPHCGSRNGCERLQALAAAREAS